MTNRAPRQPPVDCLEAARPCTSTVPSWVFSLSSRGPSSTKSVSDRFLLFRTKHNDNGNLIVPDGPQELQLPPYSPLAERLSAVKRPKTNWLWRPQQCSKMCPFGEGELRPGLRISPFQSTSFPGGKPTIEFSPTRSRTVQQNQTQEMLLLHQ